MVEINFYYPRWGSEHIEWPIFLDKVKKEGYLGIEWFPFGEKLPCDYQYILSLLEERGLKFTIVMAVIEKTNTFDEYLFLLREQLFFLAKLKPLFISAQVGREYYSVEQISRCIELCDEVELSTAVPIFQETHRNKWSYGIHRIAPILDIFPDLKLTLDLSHWYCVSESFLEDQQLLLIRILKHVHHVHARIGHTQGAQVHDVSNAINLNIIKEHMLVWQKYLDLKIDENIMSLTFTTEFGPPPYLNSLGNIDDDYQEQWRQNLWIKNYMINNLNLKNHG